MAWHRGCFILYETDFGLADVALVTLVESEVEVELLWDSWFVLDTRTIEEIAHLI